MKDIIKIVKVKSTIDGSIEEVFFIPSKNKSSPFLVNLHTWSFHKEAELDNIIKIYKLTGWNILCPEFRGPNTKNNLRAKEACASRLAKQDIIDAINVVKDKFDLDFKEIFLLGGSGGGHMALMMAAYKPQLWTAVCAWCPITDLNRWRFENPNYKEHIEKCCSKSKKEYKIRSPISYVDKIAKSTVFIFHGKNDKSVPFTQSLKFYNKIISKYPNANVYLNIFNGEHEININESISIFKSFIKKNKIEFKLKK